MTDFEMVIGLETHVELKTKSKVFCCCENKYGADPNTCVCPVCMGLPGALPLFNEQAKRLAVAAGLALGCHIHHFSRFDRKNYFYPDLPKAYQITQFYHPICEGGQLLIETDKGEKTIGITRIHIEEDAGKLTHDENGTSLDMNRCGVPLIEIVSEPDIRSAKEASAYLRKLRAILSCAGVSDCRMNEGSMRCDVNLSIHRPGQPFGTRTEMKNLNSFQIVEKAIEAEFARQVKAAENGEIIRQETRRFDQKTGQTVLMRRKENSADYRYFPEPDLPDVYVSDEEIRQIRQSLPPLPDERKKHYMQAYHLSNDAASQLSGERWLAEYFEQAVSGCHSPLALCNLILGEVFAQITLRDTEHSGERTAACLPIAPKHLSALSDLLDTGRINSTTAKKIVQVLFDSDQDPVLYAQANDLFIITDEAALSAFAQRALDENPKLVATYLGGKTNVSKALMGKAMGLSRGKADPEKLEKLVLARLRLLQ